MFSRFDTMPECYGRIALCRRVMLTEQSVMLAY